ncbi:pumilio-family RNA binding repeat-like protein [Alternaria alternata]|nr:pumilio-family RNA binding repeat-like protein [Alternaria alternata]
MGREPMLQSTCTICAEPWRTPATCTSTRVAQAAVAMEGYRGSSRRIIPRSVVLKASVAMDP